MSLSPQDLSAAAELVRDHQRILVTPHANVDPDGLGSALACYQMFTAMGKDVTVVCPDTLPESLDFLPNFGKLTQTIDDNKNFVITVNLDEGVEVDKLRYTVEDHKINIIVMPKKGRIHERQITFGQGESPYDLLVVVDTADLPLLGSLYTDHIDLFSGVPMLNIDHHISNTGFGQMQLIDSTAASATEVLYNWFMHVPEWRDAMTPDTATLLLTGLITDTRSFQNPNTTPRSLEVAAELLEHGARQQEIIEHIYKTKPLSTLKIWGRALNGIQIDKEAGIVWSSISKEDLAEMGASSKETHGLLDELISTIPEADVHILFTEFEDGSGLKASARSSTAIDVSKLAADAYGGGGHARAAGFRVTGFDNFALQVIECIQNLKQGMAAQRKAAEDAPELQKSLNVHPADDKKADPSSSRLRPSQERSAKPDRSVDVVDSLGGGRRDDASGGTDVIGTLQQNDS